MLQYAVQRLSISVSRTQPWSTGAALMIAEMPCLNSRDRKHPTSGAIAGCGPHIQSRPRRKEIVVTECSGTWASHIFTHFRSTTSNRISARKNRANGGHVAEISETLLSWWMGLRQTMRPIVKQKAELGKHYPVQRYYF